MKAFKSATSPSAQKLGEAAAKMEVGVFPSDILDEGKTVETSTIIKCVAEIRDMSNVKDEGPIEVKDETIFTGNDETEFEVRVQAVFEKEYKAAVVGESIVVALRNLFQNHFHSVRVGIIQCGLKTYRVFRWKILNPPRTSFATVPAGEDLPSEAQPEHLFELNHFTEFNPDEPIPMRLAEVETVRSMSFDPRIELDAPNDMYTHSDGP
ncbi:unnamed protein product [Phytophthora fragariaefolia]|uniref:Unnamed protein product n=1 Tax=Phytophthora fragariaefolia TaxID=1490495 RepID=A0A9W6TPI4_9STRA|nr:unnamed protein product [Phytophthora fragariaefolia]